MQEIKFRVWCEYTIDGKKHCAMAGPENWFLLTQTGHIMSYGPMSFDPNAEQKHDKLIVELFTGLKDKNGKEIFESDILKHNPEDDCWNDSVVWWSEKARFENKSFVDAFDKMSKEANFEMYQLEATMCELADWVQGSDNPSEVIGNIHDNPELLEA